MKSLRFCDQPTCSTPFANSTFLSESSGDGGNYSTVEFDRKNFAGSTPHAIKLEADQNIQLLKQALILPEYNVMDSTDSSVGVSQDKLESILGLTDSPSSMYVAETVSKPDIEEFQRKLAHNSMWNSTDTHVSIEKQMFPVASRISEPSPDYHLKHTNRTSDNNNNNENSHPNIAVKPLSAAKTDKNRVAMPLTTDKTQKSAYRQQPLGAQAVLIRNGLKSPTKSPSWKLAKSKEEFSIFSDDRRVVSAMGPGVPPIEERLHQQEREVGSRMNISKSISPIISNNNNNNSSTVPVTSPSEASRHVLLQTATTPTLASPVEHSDRMPTSFHSAPAAHPSSAHQTTATFYQNPSPVAHASYQNPSPSYQNPSPVVPVSYQNPSPSYQNPSPVSYQNPSPSYQNPSPAAHASYQNPTPVVSYQNPTPAAHVSYQNPTPAAHVSYQNPSPSYQNPSPVVPASYQNPSPSYQNPSPVAQSISHTDKLSASNAWSRSSPPPITLTEKYSGGRGDMVHPLCSQDARGIAFDDAAATAAADTSAMSNTTSSTTSAVKLGRQGGVSFGRGPCVNAYKERTEKYISMNRASTYKQVNEAKVVTADRVSVSNSYISPAIAAIPENAEATKADRKKLAFASKSKKMLKVMPTFSTQGQQTDSRAKHDVVVGKGKSMGRQHSVLSASVGSISSSVSVNDSLPSDASNNSSKSAWVDRHNVSIQCDSLSSLLSGPPPPTAAASAAAAVVSSAIKTKTLPPVVSTYINNGATDLPVFSNRPPPQQDVYLDTSSDDFSAISSDVSERVTPMMMMMNTTHNHARQHTPIFHSYNKQPHDSDSDDDFERGLGDYLNTTSSSSSAIAHHYSFEESPPVQLLGGGKSQSRLSSSSKPWSQAYSNTSTNERGDVYARSNSDVRNNNLSRSTAQSSTVLSMQTSYGLSRYSGHGRTAFSSTLGSATRVALTKDRPVFGSTGRRTTTAFDTATTTTTPILFSPLYSSKKKTTNFSEFDATFMTDVAVVTSDYSAVMSAFDDSAMLLDDSASVVTITSVDVTKAETTLTLDHNHPLDVSLLSPAEEKDRGVGVDRGPRLAVLPLRREKGAAEDIKEIHFTAAPGAQTTVVLTISNHRHRKMCMNSHALSLRFDESSSVSVKDPSVSNTDANDDDDDDDAFTVETAAPKASFSVSPPELIILPGTEGYLYVTFSPVKELEGIYSGALKIRSHRKSFIMLLRGEALSATKLSHPMQQQQHQQLPGASISVGAVKKNEANKLLERIQRLSENTFVLKTVESTSSSSVRNALGSQIRSGSLKVVSEASAVAAADATLPDHHGTLTIGPESIILQKVSSTNRYEAYVSISLGSPSSTAARASTVEVRLQSSVAFLRLSKSQVMMSTSCSKESVKVILDDSSEQLLKLSMKALSMDPSEATATLVGFISIHTSTGCEYSIDVNLTRSTCFLLHQQQQQQQQQHSIASASRHSAMKSTIGDESTPATCSTLDVSKSRYALSSHKDRYSNKEGASSSSTMMMMSRRPDDLNTTTVTTKHQKIFFSRRDETIDYINRDFPDHDDTSSTVRDSPSIKGSLLLQSGESKSVQSSSSATPATRSTRETPPSVASASSPSTSTSKQSYFRVNNSSQNAADLLLHFARSHDPDPLLLLSSTNSRTSTAEAAIEIRSDGYHREGLVISIDTPSKATTATTVTPTKVLITPSKRLVVRSTSDQMDRPSPSATADRLVRKTPLRETATAAAAAAIVTLQPEQHQQQQALVERKTGVFFRKDCINYGTVAIGSLTRANVELCNGTGEPVTVLLGDPMLPFVLLHNEVSLRAKSYVRVPVRFLPVTSGDFSNELIAQTSDGSYHARIALQGNAHA